MGAFVNAWREAQTIMIALLGLAVGSGLLRKKWLTGLSLLLVGGVAFFFRDPDRTPESESEQAILSPADGWVMEIVSGEEEPHFIQGDSQRITIFLSLFDVHVQRSPYRGVVRLAHHTAGSYKPAFLSGSVENESLLLGLETGRGPLAVRQVAGVLARRIVCRANLDQALQTGERYGLIKFGSRVDLILPPQARIAVKEGQHVSGGQTVVAWWE